MMAERFVVLQGSWSSHCCFEATVVDTTKPVFLHGAHYNDKYKPLCECFDPEDAVRIAKAMNAAEGSIVVIDPNSGNPPGWLED